MELAQIPQIILNRLTVRSCLWKTRKKVWKTFFDLWKTLWKTFPWIMNLIGL
jgi:hypothetical protein